jgi:hypothetical protein
MSIPEPEKEIVSPNDVPVAAAELPETSEAPEISPYKISFAEYKSDECQMNGMTGPNAKATLQILRDVGVHYTDEENYWSNSDGIEIKPIIRDGDYLDLYRGLPDDSEIKEIKYQREKKDIDIRLFFFTLEKERTFYLVATKEQHIDTSKGNYRTKARKSRRL